MLERAFSPRPAAERQQLLFAAIGLSAVGGISWWLFGTRTFSTALIVIAASAWFGFIMYRVAGRSVFLVLSVTALIIGRAVSWLVLLVLYVVVIAGLGGILRLGGMNRLERRFDMCKRKRSMLVDVPELTPSSFRRQS
jgi:hypothetical protein